MKKLLAILALTLSCHAQALTYYVSDCAAGAKPGCVQGSDSSTTPNQKATPFRTIAKAMATFRIAQAGDKILFAKGGSFVSNTENWIQNFNSTPDNPITLGSYSPSWYSGSQKPILTQTANNVSHIGFADGGSPEADGGYIVRDLHLKGPGNGSAIFTSQLTHDITLDNLTIENFSLGLYCGTDIPHVTLKNSKIINNEGSGVLSSCDNLLVENNTFDNNGYGHPWRNHQIYLSSGTTNDGSDGAINVVVRGNTMKNSVHFDGPSCTGAIIVGHGHMKDVLIENNKIIETTAGGEGCWGISIDGGYGPEEDVEGFSNVTIRGNLLVNVGNAGISCSSCRDWIIENNVLVWQYMDHAVGILMPTNMNPITKAGDLPTTHVTIRNNSLYYKTSSADAVGIKTSDQGTFTISSNLIYFGTSTNGKPHCFDTTNRNIGNFDSFDNNLCYGKSGKVFSQAYATMSDAQTADPRWNRDGLTGDPKLLKAPAAANSYTMALKPESPAINAGDIATCSPKAFGDVERNTSRCDIGAYEYVAP